MPFVGPIYCPASFYTLSYILHRCNLHSWLDRMFRAHCKNTVRNILPSPFFSFIFWNNYRYTGRYKKSTGRLHPPSTRSLPVNVLGHNSALSGSRNTLLDTDVVHWAFSDFTDFTCTHLCVCVCVVLFSWIIRVNLCNQSTYRTALSLQGLSSYSLITPLTPLTASIPKPWQPGISSPSM